MSERKRGRENSNIKKASPEFPPRPLSAHEYNVAKHRNPRKEPIYASIDSKSSDHYVNPDSLNKSSFKSADMKFGKPRMTTPKIINSGPYVTLNEIRRRKDKDRYKNYVEESF